MANTFELIASTTVGSGGQTDITFNTIPSTFTDLVIKTSLREGADFWLCYLTFNGSSSNLSARNLTGAGSGTPSSTSPTALYVAATSSVSGTSNTFSNAEIYIPNYAGATNKSVSIDGVSESNQTTAYATLVAGLWSNTSAITSIKLAPSSGNIPQYSTAYLYGVKNA